MQRNILLVDDDRDEISILSEAIELAGIDSRCQWARGAENAYEMVKRNLPDLILVDYNMPGINGISCMRGLKKITGVATVPILLYSTYIDPAMTREALSIGANGCIQKTLTVIDLVKTLKTLFSDLQFA